MIFPFAPLGRLSVVLPRYLGSPSSMHSILARSSRVSPCSWLRLARRPQRLLDRVLYFPQLFLDWLELRRLDSARDRCGPFRCLAPGVLAELPFMY